MPEEQTKIDYKVENVVCLVTFEIENEIDLLEIARHISFCNYDPERFPGAIIRIEVPKCTCLLFKTGKMVLTGLRNENDAGNAVKQIISIVKKGKVILKNPVIAVKNIVASSSLSKEIDLSMTSVVLDNAMYEPEVFPGVIYRMTKPKISFLIFSNGRIICAGAQSRKDIETGLQNLALTIKDEGLEIEYDEDELVDSFI